MYSKIDILEAMADGLIIIDPFDESLLQVNSYDVRVANTFYQVHWENKKPVYYGPIYYMGNDFNVPEEDWREEWRYGNDVYIPTGGTLLGHTIEKIGTFHNVVAELRSKSSTRRMGFTINCDAGLGDVGYFNHWTMELTALIDSGMAFMNVGETVAQMVFTELKTPPGEEYDGQYSEVWSPEMMIPKDYRK